MSVIISHTSVAPFIQQAALALHEAHLLERFVTTVHYDSGSRWQRMLFGVSGLLRADLERQFKRRTIHHLPAELIESHPGWELLRLAVSKIDRSRVLTDRIWSVSEPAFDKMVSRRVHPRLQAVYGYEFSSLSTFERARELGVKTIYDVPAPETTFVRGILDAEDEKFPELVTAFKRHTSTREDERTARRQAEYAHADQIIAASTVTRDSFVQAGVPTEKISVVPYGAPPPPPDLKFAPSTSSKIKLLWAGSFNIRKGAHYLLEAWKTHRLDRIADLRVFGPVLLPDSWCRPVPPGITFSASIPREELMSHYAQSDALIFPTLCDGFGMVVTEAWSQGLPVLTTHRAGAGDLLRDRENGVRFEPANIDSLAECIHWCAQHRSALAEMKPCALDTAARWQWSDYRQGLVQALGLH